jgi:hypothetical protein
MALMQIRGEQIKNNQIKDSHIQGKLTEAVLDINFPSHAPEILETKLIVDYVQKDAVTVAAGATSVDVSLSAPSAADANSKGVVLNTSIVKIRDEATGEPVNDGVSEVYGRFTAVNGTGPYTYTLEFFSKSSGTEAAYTFVDGATIDILYPQRFSLADIPENFLENERFVDGAADVTAHLNLNQVGRDLFGDSYVYNNTGARTDFFGNGNSVVQELQKQTSGTGDNSGVRAPSIIDEVIASRGNKASLDERLDVALNDDGTLKLGNRIHAHVIKETSIIADEATSVDFVFGGVDALDTPKLSDIYVIYVNGLRQLGKGASKQYTISVNGNTITVTFVDKVYKDDLIELEAIIHGTE